jgi:CRISPR type I-E-associated protein CasB/Cse2
MTKHEPDPQVLKLLQNLSALDAGEKARLKRDAGKPLVEAQSLGLFYRLLPYGLSAVQEEIYFLVATLYPLADGGGKGNLGASLRRARDPKNHKGLDRRVEILLDSDATQLPFRLRQAVRLLKSNRVTVNWQQLLEDLQRWNYSNRAAQKQWARAYFGILPKPADEVSSVSSESVSAT